MILFLIFLTFFASSVYSLRLPCDAVADVKQVNNSFVEMSFCADKIVQKFTVISEQIGPVHYEYDDKDLLKPQNYQRPQSLDEKNVKLIVQFDLEPNSQYRFFIFGFSVDDNKSPKVIIFGQLKLEGCEITECMRMEIDKLQCLTSNMQCNDVIECRDGEDEAFCDSIEPRKSLKKRVDQQIGPCNILKRKEDEFWRVVPPICSSDGWWSPLQCSHLESYESCECVNKEGIPISDPKAFLIGNKQYKAELEQECLYLRDEMEIYDGIEREFNY